MFTSGVPEITLSTPIEKTWEYLCMLAPKEINPIDGTHTMAGTPTWIAVCALVIIILGSHLLLYYKSSTKKSGFRIDVLKIPLLKVLVKNRMFPFLIQSLSMATFVIILIVGFTSSQRNGFVPQLTWTWWWALLILFVFAFGNLFCAMCPWEGFTSLVTSFSISTRVNKLGISKIFPRYFKNLYPALVLFIVLTWIELGYDVTNSPETTAVMGVTMVFMAIFFALIFEKRSFCRYVCPVGRISGIYSMLAPFEIRSKSKDMCTTCINKECLMGTKTQRGCPMFLNPAKLSNNQFCTLCTECIRSCPTDNMTINMRPVGSDLLSLKYFKKDEAIFIVVLLALTTFHGMTMTPQWTQINQMLRVETGLSKTIVFTMLMTILMLTQLLTYWVGAWSAKIILNCDKISTLKIFKSYAYSVLPLALFYHLAHNSMHFFMEAQHLIPLLSDPFGYGWNLFGTAGKNYSQLMSLEVIWWIQMSLVICGHLFGVNAADNIYHKHYAKEKNGYKSLIPLIIVMIIYSGISICLLASPMEMKSGF
ncbi:MAG: hypothetical protein KC646_04420 [Candidatus Cloacimonetes bacterium]|nr:hypothetical protein [Candidatus Cloacimonadota bacterium]